MTNTRSMFNSSSLVAAALCFAAFSAQAGGTHADNHGHSESIIGKPAKMSQVTKTITVDMGDDMRFTPEKINIRKGDVVHFNCEEQRKGQARNGAWHTQGAGSPLQTNVEISRHGA